MPATITHAYFAIDVFDVLPNSIKEKISSNRMKMFGQSMDALMFYNLFNIKPGKDIRRLSKIFHSSKTKDYFINLINYIKDNNLYDDTDTCSYLCGLICHYVLDSTLHPFIFYKTGKFNKKDPNTYKYNNIHTFMETFIDNDMIKRREKLNPYKFNIGSFWFDNKPFSKSLNKAIDFSFEKTFSISNMAGIYYNSLKHMKFALSIFRKDSFGIKKIMYKLVDTFTPKGVFRFEAISYHYNTSDIHNFLNSNHNLWRNPVCYSISSTESFLDLYLKSIKLAKEIIISSFSYFNNNSINLENVFTNRSYLTGLDCDLNKEMKYFEF